MKVLGPEIFGLDDDESFTIHIDCEGGAFLAFGNVNGFDLPFDDATPQADVTPAVLAGPGSANRVHLHLVYPQDTPPASYRITVIDAQNNEVDAIDSTLIPNRPRPYRVDVDLVVQVA